MRDISSKNLTLRRARATAVLKASRYAIGLLKKNRLPKHDPLPVAKVAAVQAAKQTSILIPYCHPLPIDFVECRFVLRATTVVVETEVKSIYKTGVEMEALSAASAAALTLYDMMKGVDADMEISGIRLIEKTGGKSDFQVSRKGRPRKAAVLVLSDSIARGRNPDASGKILQRRLREAGFTVVGRRVIADDAPAIEQALKRYADSLRLDLVITTGGTGLGPRDVTPEATARIINREAPGIGEALRSAGIRKTPFSMLSRGISGIRGRTLIINLPGSIAGVNEAMDVLLPVLPHAMETMGGADHRGKKRKS
ncbi:MAG: bifunctional molybdenum cofactor biosynthesis protein MoaC/MoaB [Bacteroidota bacterium]